MLSAIFSLTGCHEPPKITFCAVDLKRMDQVWQKVVSANPPLTEDELKALVLNSPAGVCVPPDPNLPTNTVSLKTFHKYSALSPDDTATLLIWVQEHAR